MKLDDIKKLADLARIDMSESEMNEIAKDFEPILAYVGQVQEAVKLISTNKDGENNKKSEDYSLQNVVRDDVVTNNKGEYTDKIINEVPDTQDGFIKVKQIM